MSADFACEILISGQVQGVGFRPFVYRLACELGVRGDVRNVAGGVRIRLSGSAAVIQSFLDRVQTEHPPQARIKSITTSDELTGDSMPDGFEIVASDSESSCSALAQVSPDQRVCDTCLRELLTPGNPRYLYPFIGCCDCGPRFSIVRELPYDRQRTSLAAFPPCACCLAEYQDPSNRRFHAQNIVCPDCGPSYALYSCAVGASRSDLAERHDAIQQAAHAIAQGKIVAVQSLSGFHLICDARNDAAVSRLRTAKRRPAKPFALMAANLAALEPLVALNAAACTLLRSAAAPIVLVPKNPQAGSLIRQVAPELSDLGCLLAYAPIHHLLFQALSRTCRETALGAEPGVPYLVATSANLNGEPLIHSVQGGFEKLVGIADLMLAHDLIITQPCDDSILQAPVAEAQRPVMLRRARGYVPQALPCAYTLSEPGSGHAILAVGAGQKNTFCLTHPEGAWLSPHLGDLSNADSCRHFVQTIHTTLALTGIVPDSVACDLHTDFFCTQWARSYAQQKGLPCVAVQHHHAHLAAVMAEHQLDGPVVGLALDGLGLGMDDSLWGGERFVGSLSHFERTGHFKALALPGGDRASRAPWTLGLAFLAQAAPQQIEAVYPLSHFAGRSQILETLSLAPHSSSAGRWFDLLASILGLCHFSAYEAHAAMVLESAASRWLSTNHALPPARSLIRLDDGGVLDPTALVLALMHESDIGFAAARFHAELVDALVRWVQPWHRNLPVVCAGGCFQNRVLREALSAALSRAGFAGYFAETVPANDGGIAFGQAVILAARSEVKSDRQESTETTGSNYVSRRSGKN